MKTIQVVLDDELLEVTDKAARREKVNRSALIRQALEEHLRRLAVRDLEERDRSGYMAKPQLPEQYLHWEDVAVWPNE